MKRRTMLTLLPCAALAKEVTVAVDAERHARPGQGDDRVELRDMPVPEIGDGDVLLRVKAADTGQGPQISHFGPESNLLADLAYAAVDPRIEFESATVEEFDELVAINLRSYFVASQAALPFPARVVVQT